MTRVPGSRIAACLAFQPMAVAYEGRSPITVAGPRRLCTDFLHRHRSYGYTVLHIDGNAGKISSARSLIR